MRDDDLYETWCAMSDAGRHDENLRTLARALEARPDDANLHLLLASTLLALDRTTESVESVRRAAACADDDPGILTRVASLCFYAGDVSAARSYISRAKEVAPRGFPLRRELKDLERRAARRARGMAAEARLTEEFDADPGRPGLAAELARHLAANGQRYAAYHAVARGLHYHPDDRTLRRLEKKLRREVPADVRDEAEQWAASDQPFSIPG